jgi:hypothetical protein
VINAGPLLTGAMALNTSKSGADKAVVDAPYPPINDMVNEVFTISRQSGETKITHFRHD